MNQINRRKFLKKSAAATAMALSTPLFSSNLSTVGEDYKALVCVMLEGGVDAFSMVVPKEPRAYAKYQEARGDISIYHDSLLTLRGSDYGLHPKMPRMQRMFNQNNLAIIANVGNLHRPISHEEIAQAKKGEGLRDAPVALFSQQTQENFWMMQGNEEAGWAGKVAEVFGEEMVNVALGEHTLMQHHHDYKTLVIDMASEGTLEEQLTLVSKLLSHRKEKGFAKRQIYFVKFKGWDNHKDKIGESIAILDKSFGSFAKELEKQGLQDKVTTFTMSEFGRTISSYEGCGSRGWGSHAFVFGGAVNAGIHGVMPSLEKNSVDALANSAVVPTISSSQYLASLVHWLGDGKIDVEKVFPSLKSFEKKQAEFVVA
jgi:uncharacterized protein (DUF1501 family)